MAIILVPKFTKAQIAEMMKRRKDAFRRAILMRLQFVGEQFVRNARERATFKDRTGNLRSSIGYVVLKDGKQLYGNFEQVKGGKAGVDAAKKLIRDAKKNFPEGYALIGVAGMEYAAAVESKGFDVITSSSIEAETSLKKAIKALQEKATRL